MADYIKESKLRWFDDYCISCGTPSRNVDTLQFIVPIRHESAQHLAVFRCCAEGNCKHDSLQSAYDLLHKEALQTFLFNY